MEKQMEGIPPGLAQDHWHQHTRGSALARLLAALFAAGAALIALSLALAHPAVADERGLLGVAGAALLVALASLAAARLFTTPVVHGVVAIGSALICFGVYFSGETSSVFSLVAVWVPVFVGVFFAVPALFAHLAFLLASYAVALVAIESSAGFSAVTAWVVAAVALVGTAAMTAWLAGRRRAAEERASHFFDLSRDLLCTVEPSGVVVDASPAWGRTLGYSPIELQGRNLFDLIHSGDRERTRAVVERLMNDGVEAVDFENRYRAKNGSWHWLRWNGALSPEGDLIYAQATDVTEHRALLDQIAAQARTDPLTGLPNARWLDEELDRAMAVAQRTGSKLCLAVLDFDHFKALNDRLGYLAADRFLRAAVSSWRATMRAGDFLARVRGEQFAALFADAAPAEAEIAVERMRANTPAGETCSAGIVVWDFHESASALHARAQQALEAAKERGRDRCVIEA